MFKTEHGDSRFEELISRTPRPPFGRQEIAFLETHRGLDLLWEALLEASPEVPLTGLPRGAFPRIDAMLDQLTPGPKSLQDCQHVAITVLRQAGVEIPSVDVPISLSPRRSDYSSESEFAKACAEVCDAVVPEHVSQAQFVYFERMYELARRFEIPFPEPIAPDDARQVDVAEPEVKRLTASICHALVGKSCSRHVGIWRDFVFMFAPAHSAILLGKTAAPDDLWLIEKRGLSGPVVPNLLSNVIRGVCEFAPAWSFPKFVVRLAESSEPLTR